MKLTTIALVSFAALAGVSSIASAVTSFGSVSPTKSNGDFIPGGGVPANNFTIDTAATGESVALKARDRSTGQAIAQVGNRYIVHSGLVGSSPNQRAAWNFDFQFSPGANSTAQPSDYTYEIVADTNPVFGGASNVSFLIPPNNATPAAPAGDSFYANPGTWTGTAPFVIANSENYNFGFLAGPAFTNASPAEYNITFSAYSVATGALVARTSIIAEVQAVPEPTTLAAIAGASVLGLRRRRA